MCLLNGRDISNSPCAAELHASRVGETIAIAFLSLVIPVSLAVACSSVAFSALLVF